MLAFKEGHNLTGSNPTVSHTRLYMLTPPDPVGMIFSQVIDYLSGSLLRERKLVDALRVTLSHEEPINLTPIILIGGGGDVNLVM
ncbi:hypothetical protein GCM10009092_01590 [Bowmanella denitrificans]|uniref:Uncharacterized protein n=1 Tax=Bowmanella denitrificans TaxID=366582 RepID=A0ABN0WL46_9ALTE